MVPVKGGEGFNQPLLFRGGDQGVVAMRQHRSRQRRTKAPTDVTLKSKGPFSDERNHPNPSFEKEGLKNSATDSKNLKEGAVVFVTVTKGRLFRGYCTCHRNTSVSLSPLCNSVLGWERFRSRGRGGGNEGADGFKSPSFSKEGLGWFLSSDLCRLDCRRASIPPLR